MSTPEDAFQAAYYYSCLYNSLALFAASPSYLHSLAGPVFDPVFELESEYEYAFNEPVFEANFRHGKVSKALRNDLLAFKSQVDAVPASLWRWESIVVHSTWAAIRLAAEELLVKLGESRRTYDADFTTIIPA
ncbi:hypothetical protein E5K00_00460 [Hymenobacter aquaticus]|uniref:Uncharacterized protein n=1 Tax=Hymenobacter aquaticus TaxID=1867101 RepID=A0A4Z0Q2L2_9BACT|nr:hypothetical protein [Hymenobacter aquaticus]TGE23719.1 hypothetical protein E5K00_00460 [Hymenobacter aquaticus]